MSAGTLTLTNNSDAVTGSGTAFTTELAAGDFIVVKVGGVPYTLPVKTVNSNTLLTLVSNYTGPTQSGAAWSAVPRVALNMVTAALVAQSAEALRGLNYDKQNWQDVFSAAGNITVFLPDGSSFSGPSWKSIADKLSSLENGYLKKTNNLSDLENRGQAWKNILPTNSTISDDGRGANALWPVINSSNVAPGTGVYVYGGTIRSEYYINDTRANAFAIQSSMVNSNVTGVISLTNDLTGTTSYLYLDDSGGLRSSTGYVGFPSEGIGIDTNGNNSRIYFMDASKTRRAGFSYELSDSSFVLYKFTASGTLGYSVAFPTTGGTLALQGTSGIEFKHNVKDADLNEAVDRIDALRMVNFVYNDDEQARVRFGIIAEEAEKVAPQYIKHNPEIYEVFDADGSKTGESTRDRPSVDNNPIVMDLLGYVKHLKAEIEMLKTALTG